MKEPATTNCSVAGARPLSSASAPVAECFALKVGLAAAKRFGYNNFFAEGDSSLIINCIVPVEVPWRLKSLVREILELSQSFSPSASPM